MPAHTHALYFTNWSIYSRGYAPSKLPCELLTHVIYAFLKPDPESGDVRLSDPWADIEKPMELGGKGCIGELAILKRQHRHLRVLLSVGGWTYSPDLTQIFADPQKRRRFVQTTLALAETYKFDGVDVDWEYAKTPEEARIFVEILQSLRNGLDELEKKHGCALDLTIAAPAGKQYVDVLLVKEMNRILSWWNVMTYDFSGAWSPTAEHHANLYGGQTSGEQVVDLYMQAGLPADKIVLGMPLYGRSFRGARKIGDKFDGVLPGKYEAGWHDVSELPLAGSAENIDTKAGACICVTSEGLVTYDTNATAIQKAEFVAARGLRGGMWWEASNDRLGDQSLVAAFARTATISTKELNWI